MKNVLYTFYNFYLDNIKKNVNDYYFYYNEQLYMFCLVENSVDIIQKIYNYLVKNNINTYKIILNKDNKLFTKVEEKYYSLLLLKGILKYEIKFDEFKYYPMDGVTQNWGILWGNRLDYYEIQLRELGHKYQTVLNSFGFFQGMAENAIQYYNSTLSKFNDEKTIGIVHNRMYYPCYSIEYDNPLNFVIDYSVRDISEYIKSYVMSEEFNVENVIESLSRLNISKLMFNLLFARLLYPTFYFDIFDNIILGSGDDDEVIRVLNRVDNYLFMLNEVYSYFNQKYELFNVEWLNKNVEI